MARLFVAVWPPEEVVEAMRGLPRKDRPGFRWVPPENWHTTLRFLGDADAGDVADRLDHADLPAADARYGPAVDVLFDRVVAVPVHGLDELAAAVVDATRDLGDAPRKRFHGHVTLGRVKRGGRVPPVVGLPVGGEQEVAEVALVSSTLRPDGAVHETIATWPTR